MPDPPSSPEPRRRFLGRLGATLAAGLGLAAFGTSSAGAGTRPDVAGAPSRSDVARATQNCAIYCYTYSCPGGCATGRNLFRCEDRCSGTWYYCLQHSCSSYCYSSSAC